MGLPIRTRQGIGVKTNRMKTLTLIVRQWLNRSTGATVASVEIVSDGHSIARLPHLGATAVDMAISWLQISGLLPAKTGVESLHSWLASLGVTFHATQCSVTNKSEL